MKKVLLLIFVTSVVVMAAWAIYEMGAASLQEDSGPRPAPRGWVLHKDPAGFSLNLPQAWIARADRTSGRVEIQGGAGEQMVVWPVFIPAAMDPRSASSVLGRFVAKYWPETRWETPQPNGATAVRVQGSSKTNRTVVILTWVNSPKGSAGYIYKLGAPESRYRQAEEIFAGVLSSFRLVGAPVAAQPPGPTYVRWQDPRENAFSLEVPTPWSVQGGLFRFASVDVRPAIEVISPDRLIRITGGDSEIPPFTIPNATLQMSGFNEGSWYSPGYGTRMLVRRFMSGTAFAQDYVITRAARGCSDIAVTDMRDRPDAVQAINAIAAQYNNTGISSTLHAGEAAFTCNSNGRSMRGYYFATTRLTEGYGTGLWSVEYLYGYLAALEKQELAQSILEHMLKTTQANPQWVAMQQNVTAETSKIVSRTSEEISNIISSSYWKRQETMDELSRRRSNATLGMEDVFDSTTGRQIKVESGANYYWVDPRGTIVGTQTDTRPNIDFRELVRLP